MADHQIYTFLFVVLFSAFAFSSHAYQLIVGGKYGWGLNPSENYNHWAQRLRFQVNDTLLFKYKKESDSVLVVTKDHHDQCNISNPTLKLDGGYSVFKFDRSGPFFFISGNQSSCAHGQKLIVVVLAVRTSRSPPRAPSPAAAPPTWPPHSPSPYWPPEGPAPAPYGPSANSTAGGGPPKKSAAAAAWGPAVVWVSTVSVVMSVCLGGFVFSF